MTNNTITTKAVEIFMTEAGKFGYEAEVVDITKPNCICKGISFKEINPSPVFYFDVIENEFIERGINGLKDIINSFASDDVRDSLTADVAGLMKDEKIIPCLCATEGNEDFLKGIPHREFLDMSVYYRYMDEIDGRGIRSTVIKTSEHTEEELYDIATGNMNYNYESLLEKIEREFDIPMSDMVGDDVIPTYYCAAVNKTTGIKNIYGASFILNKEKLAEIAEKHQADLAIYPSSIHEVILNPIVDGCMLNASDVTEANETVVDDKDVLTNSVYLYNRETGEISIK